MTTAERATQAQKNVARLAEVNEWLGAVDLDVWDVLQPMALRGYVVGVFMRRTSDGYTILATDGARVAQLTPTNETNGGTRDAHDTD